MARMFIQKLDAIKTRKIICQWGLSSKQGRGGGGISKRQSPLRIDQTMILN
jgi:hypothetical protein